MLKTFHRCVLTLLLSTMAFTLANAWGDAAELRGSIAERRGPCVPDGRMKIAVELVPPEGKPLAGVRLNLDYPEQAVGLPGSADQSDVKARVKDASAGFLFSPNDLDGALVVAIVGTSGFPAGAIFTVEFDRCKGVPKAATKDFRCTIEQASTELGVLVAGATCTVRAVGDENTTSKGRSL